MPKINKILEVYLSLDESLVGDDKIVRPRAFRLVMTVVAVVVASFFAAIIIATGGQSK